MSTAVRWLADENFNGKIVRALLRRKPGLDIVRVQDVGLAGKTDPQVLTWAADAGRLILTHDVTTMTAFCYDRFAAGETTSAVFEVSRSLPIREVVEDIILISDYSDMEEWSGKVIFLPLR